MKSLKVVLLFLLSLLFLLGTGCSKSENTPVNSSSAYKSEAGITPSANSGQTSHVKPISMDQLSNIHFEYDASADELTSNIKYWMKDKKTKMEMSYNGQSIIFFIDAEKNTMYQYMPEINTALAITSPEITTGNELETNPLGDLLQHFDGSYAIGTEEINGVKCHLYEVSSDTFKGKYYLAEETGFPMKVEAEIEGLKTSTIFKNVKFNSVTEKDVTLPDSAQIADPGDLSDAIKDLENMVPGDFNLNDLGLDDLDLGDLRIGADE